MDLPALDVPFNTITCMRAWSRWAQVARTGPWHPAATSIAPPVSPRSGELP